MKRVVIIGCGGAGKSTLARALGEKTGLPVVHLDKIFWKPDWVSVSSEEFDAALAREMEKEQWIMDGNFNRTLPERVACCDTVIYLDFNRVTCLLSWLKRVMTHWHRSRPDITEGCEEWLDPEFAKWIWSYNKTKRQSNYRLLNEATHAETIVLKNRRAVKRFLKSVS